MSRCRLLAALVMFLWLPMATLGMEKWTSLASLPGGGATFPTTLVVNGTILIVGGCSSTACTDTTTATQSYSLQYKRMVGMAPGNVPLGVVGSHHTVLLDQWFYTLPACSKGLPHEPPGVSDTTTFFKWRYGDATVTQKTFTIGHRYGASCVTMGTSVVYIIGGIDGRTGVPVAYVSALDVNTGDFTEQVATLPMPMYEPAVAATANAVIIGFGKDVRGAQREGRAFVFTPDHSACQMTELPPLAHGIGSAVDAGIGIFGGLAVALFLNATHQVTSSIQWTQGAQGTWSANDPERSLTPYGGGLAATTYLNNDGTTFLAFVAAGAAIPPYSTQMTRYITEHTAAGPIPTAVAWHSVIVNNAFSIPLHQRARPTMECNASFPCNIVLTRHIDCSGEHIAGGGQQWTGGSSPPSFYALEPSPFVYLCLAAADATVQCGGGSYRLRAFVATNPMEPMSIVPTATPNPAGPPHGPGGCLGDNCVLRIALYTVGGLAGLLCLIAVGLFCRSKHRKSDAEVSLLGIDSPTRNRSETTVAHSGALFASEGKYQTLQELGRGAFSTVFVVSDRSSGDKCAMKLLECPTDEERYEAIKEVEVMRSLQGHPNIIELYDLFMNYELDGADTITVSKRRKSSELDVWKNQSMRGSTNVPPIRKRHLCIVMQYHESGDLSSYTIMHATLSECTLGSIAYQLCSVLKHIHQHEPPIIHRDLKPENILVSHPKPLPPHYIPIVVTDFGLARCQTTSHCVSGAGTLPYIAPECFKKKYGTKCDVWSMGCVLYAVATKRLKERSRNMFADADSPNFEQVLRSDLASSGYSAAFANFLLQIFQMDPDHRPTAAECLEKMYKREGKVYFM